MPDIMTIARIIGRAEAVVGRLSRAARVALLDEHFPEVPARDLSEAVKGL